MLHQGLSSRAGSSVSCSKGGSGMDPVRDGPATATSVLGGLGSRGSPALGSMAEPADPGIGSRRVAGCPARRHIFQVESGASHARAAIRAPVLVQLIELSRVSLTRRRAR